MHILVILLYVLMHFHIIYNIFWTNLLIQCPVPVSVSYCLCIAEKVKIKSARKIPEKYHKNIHNRRLQKTEGVPRGDTYDDFSLATPSVRYDVDSSKFPLT